jgi:hypothetical protein
MPRYLFVVSRGHPEMYVQLLERFAGDKNVEVIMDRRMRERRRQRAAGLPQRDRADRRHHPEVDAELQRRSHAIVTLPDRAV